jgi:hypothetical protein
MSALSTGGPAKAMCSARLHGPSARHARAETPLMSSWSHPPWTNRQIHNEPYLRGEWRMGAYGERLLALGAGPGNRLDPRDDLHASRGVMGSREMDCRFRAGYAAGIEVSIRARRLLSMAVHSTEVRRRWRRPRVSSWLERPGLASDDGTHVVAEQVPG